jgi:hypothetical protein
MKLDSLTETHECKLDLMPFVRCSLTIVSFVEINTVTMMYNLVLCLCHVMSTGQSGPCKYDVNFEF